MLYFCLYLYCASFENSYLEKEEEDFKNFLESYDKKEDIDTAEKNFTVVLKGKDSKEKDVALRNNFITKDKNYSSKRNGRFFENKKSIEDFDESQINVIDITSEFHKIKEEKKNSKKKLDELLKDLEKIGKILGRENEPQQKPQLTEKTEIKKKKNVRFADDTFFKLEEDKTKTKPRPVKDLVGNDFIQKLEDTLQERKTKLMRNKKLAKKPTENKKLENLKKKLIN